MSNFFKKKRKLFPDWLENKTPKIFIFIIIFVCFYFLFGSLQTIWQQYKCTSRGYTWFSIPPSSKAAIEQSVRKFVNTQTKNHYKEDYVWGVCANMKETLN